MKILLVFILIIPLTALTQLSKEQEAIIDSLKKVINQTDQDTVIINALVAWDDIIWISNPELDYQLNDKIDSICTINLKKNINRELKLKFLKEKAVSLNKIGVICQNKSEFQRAINFINKSFEIRKEIGDKDGITSCLNNFGIIYFQQGDYAKAIENYTQSLKIREELNDKKGIAESCNNIGIIYQEQGEYDKALKYFTKSLKLEKELGNKFRIAGALNNFGLIYNFKKDFGKALKYYKKSLKIREEIGDKKGVAISLNNIGLIYKRQNNFDKSVDYLTESHQIMKSIGDQQGVANTLNNIARVYKEQGDFAKVLKKCLKSLSISKRIGSSKEIESAAFLLWYANKKMGRYKKALEMFELFISTRDSIQSEANQKEIIRQEYKYQYEKQAAADSVKAAEAAKVKDAKLAAEKAENKQHQIEAKQQRQQKYFLYGGLALALVFGGFIFNRFRVTRKQKGVIEEQKEKVDVAYEQLGEKNQEILDSINYAKRIQSAILPPQKLVKEYIPDSFILYKPKDIVAGDFYWMEHTKDQILFAAADCTGHGVPGAMVSVVCNNGLNRSVREHGLTQPAKILDKTREIVISEFEKSEEEVKDGMDIALVSLKHERHPEPVEGAHASTIIEYSGAHNPLWIIRKGASEIEEIKADKQPIGKFGAEQPFTNHTVELQKGDSIYIFSDGYADQFGGEKGKKFKSKNFKKLLLSVQNETMERQHQFLDEAFEEWKGDIEQLDDVCVIGVRL